jgi:CHAT domain-containing protein
MEIAATVRRRAHLLVLLVLAGTSGPAAADGGAEGLLAQGTADLDAAVTRFRVNSVLPGPADLAAAEQSLTGAATAAAARADWPEAAQAYVQLNRLERMLNRWDAAVAAADRGVQAARKAAHHELEARALLGRSLAELSNHDFAHAEVDADAALRAAGDKADVKLRFELLRQRAAVQVDMGRTNAADEMLAAALKLPGLEDAQLVYGYMDRGEIYFRISYRCDQDPVYDVCLDALRRSSEAYEQAMAAARRLGWPGLEKLARIQRDGSTARAAVFADKRTTWKAMLDSGHFHPASASDVLVTELFAPPTGTPSPQQLQDFLKSQAGVRRDAEQLAKMNVRAARSSSIRTLYVDGLTRAMKGDHAGALALFQQAVEAVEQDHRALPDDVTRSAFFAEYFPVYVSAARELLDAKRFAEAFATIEKSRARAMAELLAGRRLQLGGDEEQALYGDTLRLDHEIAAKLAARFDAATSDAATPALDAEIARLRQARARLVQRMHAEAPGLQTLSGAQTVDLAQLQELARTDGCEVLEYVVTDTNVIVLYISATEFHAKNVFLPRDALAGAVNELLGQVSLDKAPERPFDHTRARELYWQLLQPVRGLIRGDRLVILPHDVLTALPFELLEDPADGTPVGTRFQLSYAPSATTYAALRRWSPGGHKKLLAVADPGLEGTAHEVNRVAAVYHQRPAAPGAALVTKRQLRQRLSGADVVHLSVHGHFDAQEPLLSDLALAADRADDGRLTAADMFGLPLAKTGLVVLSACESGRAQSSVANEEVGMIRALLYAGAGSIVLSRWKVDAAATATWMETFHREAQRHSLPQAARTAVQAVRADPAFDHPYYWAAFSLVGR